MHWLRSLAVLALLVMMIYKPGAVIVSAAVRPDSWNFPLLLHVLGAMLLVGALILAASAFLLTWRGGSAPLARLGYRAMLLGRCRLGS